MPPPETAAADTGPRHGEVSGRDFETPRAFAIAAVRDAGYSPALVARVLHVPTSRVRDWVAGLDGESD